MEYNCVVEGNNLYKKLKKFELNIPKLRIPEGYATALIGENGAGKSTLLNMMSGIRLDYKGELKYFGEYDDKDRETKKEVKNRIAYTGPGRYYLSQWTVADIEEISSLLFDNFDKSEFQRYCDELAIFPQGKDKNKKNSELSDGTRMKLMLAGAMARTNTDLLILDEPASPLDPLMRDKLCQMIGDYINDGAGKRSVFFSTHNISDMESITDYAVIMEHGEVVEAGFVEELKEKYILVKGESEDAEAASKVLYTISKNPYGFEGICLAENLNQLAGMDVTMEAPSLYQISVAVMKKNTKLVMR